MPTDDVVATRTVTTLSLGARLSLLGGLLLLILAAYFTFVPIQFDTQDGSPFRCGSVADPVGGTFARNVCADRNRINEYRAIATGAAAVVVGLGGALAFGLVRRKEVERTPQREPERDELV